MCKLVTLGIILVSILFCATSSPHQPVLCPLQCVCHHQQDRHVINCSHKNLTSLPFLCNFENDASRKKVEFYANGNKFRYVLKSAFYHVRNRLGHLEITSNSFNIELAHSAFNSFVDSLEILKLEPVNENVNTLIDSLKNLNKLKVLQLISATDSFQILSSKFSNPNLTELSLEKCRIRNISSGVFRGLIDLKILNLGFNHLAGFPQELVDAVSRSVSVLRLSNNEIWEINDADFNKGCKLGLLDLSFNSISFIKDGVLEKCVRLRFLNLSHNPNLISLGSSVFDGLFGLSLDISHSPVPNLDFVKPVVLARVLAFGTSLECSCDVQVKYMEALHGNLKGTCMLKLNVTNIQSKPLNCMQYEQRQKSVRLNNGNDELEKGVDLDTIIDTDPNRPEHDSGLNVHTELQPSTGVAYLDKSQETTRKSCKNKPCTNFDNFKSKIEGRVKHETVADFSEPLETRDEPIEKSAAALRLSPSTSTDSFLDIFPASVNSESIRPSPILSVPIRSEPSSALFQASTVVGFEMQVPADLPDGDNLVRNAEKAPDGKTKKMPTMPQQKQYMPVASREIADSAIEPYKAVFLSTSMLDISMTVPEPRSSFTPDIPSARSEISSAKPEMPTDASKHQSFITDVNIDAVVSMHESGADTFSHTNAIRQHTAQTQMSTPSSTSQQTSAACEDCNHAIQPLTTNNIVNSISSSITYKRDYTYFIQHVDQLNPRFLPPTKTRDYEHTESVKDHQNSDAPRAMDAKEKEAGSDFQIVPKELGQHSPLEAGNKRQNGHSDELSDEHRDNVQGYFFQGPVYVLACFVHACLLFVAFLKREPGVKIKK